MTTPDNGKGMTLAEAINVLNNYVAGSTNTLVLYALDAIDAHLAQRDVTDEDVERACVEYFGDADWREFTDDAELGFISMRHVLQSFAASLPVAKVDVSGWDAIQSMEFFVREGLDAHPENIEGWLEDFREALLSQSPVVVRYGWKLVPVEPTDAMLTAFGGVEINDTYGTRDHYLRDDADEIVTAIRVWQAMLAAAPAYDDGGNGNG